MLTDGVTDCLSKCKRGNGECIKDDKVKKINHDREVKVSFKKMKTLLSLATEQGYDLKTVSSFAIFARTVKL